MADPNSSEKSRKRQRLLNAVNSVQDGQFSIRKAAKYFKVPYSTLVLHLKGWKSRSKAKSIGKGRPTIIDKDVELELASNLKTMAKWGFGLTRSETLTAVGIYVKENNLKNLFRNGVPGNRWFSRFKKQFRLSCKKPDSIEQSRMIQTTPFVIYGFYDLMEELIRDLGLSKSPGQIWNLDESSFCTDPSSTKAVGGVGEPVLRQTSGPGRNNISAMCCVSADGRKLPPFIIFKAKNMWDSWMNPQAYPGTAYACSEGGNMERELFSQWFQEIFLKTALPERPLLLIYDGHASHVSLTLIRLAQENLITLLLLPPHTTHLLQPLDVSVFAPLKIIWDRNLVSWQRENYGSNVTKNVFSKLVGDAWSELRASSITSGFRKTGIFDATLEFPVNRNVIPESLFDPSKLAAYKRRLGGLDSEVVTMAEGDITSDRPLESPEVAVSPQVMLTSEQPSTSSENPRSFTQLLLSKVGRTDNPKLKRSRVNNMAQVITRESFAENLALKEKNMKPQIAKQSTKKRQVQVNKKAKNEKDASHVKARKVTTTADNTPSTQRLLRDLNQNVAPKTPVTTTELLPRRVIKTPLRFKV